MTSIRIPLCSLVQYNTQRYKRETTTTASSQMHGFSHRNVSLSLIMAFRIYNVLNPKNRREKQKWNIAAPAQRTDTRTYAREPKTSKRKCIFKWAFDVWWFCACVCVCVILLRPHSTFQFHFDCILFYAVDYYNETREEKKSMNKK